MEEGELCFRVYHVPDQLNPQWIFLKIENQENNSKNVIYEHVNTRLSAKAVERGSLR